ncbi:MAG TPA: STAS domain-containing protein [Streptosporangiaceae bacterium]
MRNEVPLTVQLSQLGEYAVVAAAGSIDFSTHELLEEELNRALKLTRTAVIVDVADVTFCDSTGLNAFVRARRLATARGIVVVIAGLRDRVEYVFGITHLDRAFYSQPDTETAIRWLENGSSARDTS